MTTILSIETSTEAASIALLRDQHILARDFAGVQTHSRGILPSIQTLLAEADLSLQDCDAIAFNCGPGAFTGVRTACGIVQGLAFGAGIPVVSVVSLIAMAEAARLQYGCHEVLVLLDARMGEVYSGRYRYEDGTWLELQAPELARAADLLAAQPAESTVVHGKGVDTSICAVGVSAFHCEPHAEHVARLGLQGFLQGRAADAASAQPLYVRNKVALTTQERIAAGQVRK